MIGAGRARERDGEALHALPRYGSPECLCARAVPYVREVWVPETPHTSDRRPCGSFRDGVGLLEKGQR
jgi:hypothetical protein